MKCRLSVAVVVTLAMLTSPVWPASRDSANMDIGLSPPDLAAFTLLGINSNRVSRPGSIKDIAFAFMNAGVTGSEIAPNIGIEWSPGKTFGANDLKSYQDGNWWRNMQLSFATGQDSLGKSVGLGWRWVPIDMSDPLMDEGLTDDVARLLENPRGNDIAKLRNEFVNKTIKDTLDTILKGASGDALSNFARLNQLLIPHSLGNLSLPPVPSTPKAAHKRVVDTLAAMGIVVDHLPDVQRRFLVNISARYVALSDSRFDWEEYAGQALIKQKEEFKKRSWNAQVIHLATGAVWTSFDGSWKGLRTNYIRSYVGASIPLKQFGQLVCHAEYDHYVRDDSERDHAYAFGLRLLAGGSDLRLTFEGLYDKDVGNQPMFDAELLRLTLGTEVRLKPDLWLELGFGGEGPLNDFRSGSILTLASLKYALNPSSKIKLANQ